MRAGVTIVAEGQRMDGWMDGVRIRSGKLAVVLGCDLVKCLDNIL